MSETNNFLNYHASCGTGFLHPGGFAFTELLLKEIGLREDLKVLEVGCGTGATIVYIAEHYKTFNVAVDFSTKMLSVAKQRAWFKGLSSKIDFLKISENGLMPFPDNYFDCIYAESVLAIVDEQTLPILVKEIYRVLKPKGKFITNDAIWRNSSEKMDIDRINNSCLRDFGIMQSVSNPAYKSEWISFFEKSGFKILKVEDKIRLGTISYKKAKKDLFWLYRKIVFLINPFMQLKRIKYKKALKGQHLNDGNFLENVLFVMQNKK